MNQEQPKQHSDKPVRIIVQGKHVYVPTTWIEYVSGQSNYSTYHLTNGSNYMIAHSLTTISGRVGEGFLRINKGHLCNRRHIVAVDLAKPAVQLRSGLIVPIARRRVMGLLPELLPWLIGQ